MNRNRLCAALALCGSLIAAAVPASAQTVVTFDQGSQGFVGNAFHDTTLGNAAPAMHTLLETFGVSLRTTTNAAFIGDYTQSPSVTIGLDVLTNSITYLGTEVSREAVIELRDYDNPAEGMPYTSVWTTLGTLSAASGGWRHLSVTIDDTSATALPTGWGGYGAEDPVTFEPMLPAGRTFASVLAGVDEFVFTTFVPGYFYGFTVFDMAMDNISISAVPEPSSMVLMGLGVLGLVAARRTRRRD